MAVTKIFTGTEKSVTDDTEMTLYINNRNELYVRIKNTDCNEFSWICLDYETAKALSDEILNQIKEIEPKK